MASLTFTQFHTANMAGYYGSPEGRAERLAEEHGDGILERVVERITRAAMADDRLVGKMADALAGRVWDRLPAATRKQHLGTLSAKQACSMWSYLDAGEKALCRKMHGPDPCVCEGDCDCRGPKKGAAPRFVTKSTVSKAYH